MILHDQLHRELIDRHRQLIAEGQLPSQEQLAQYYATFRARFGPEQLLALDGEALLEAMYDNSNRSSLVYWLEFKNDEELPAYFGSIAGGSALKFGLYRRQENRAWMTGSPQHQVELSTGEAIDLARRYRDQLMGGARLLAQFPNNADDEQYRQLQQQLDQVAPDVSTKAWGHKYLHMIFPGKLDDFHAEWHQRFHLIKLLQMPPEGGGRYLAAGRYVAIARELDMPLNHLSSILNRRDGSPHRYWQVQVVSPNLWEDMRNKGYVAIGWGDLGDLSEISYDQPSKNRLRDLMKTTYGDRGGFQEVFSFAAAISPGDFVLAFKQPTVLGIGRVTGSYEYDPATAQFPHHHPVEWLSLEKGTLPHDESHGRTVREIRDPENQVAVERRAQIRTSAPAVTTFTPAPAPMRLTGVPGQIQSTLERKKQVILYGPPGTGKTYWAMRAAQDLAALAAFGRPFDKLEETEKAVVRGGKDPVGSLVRMCTFHPAYGYEDFIEGYRPETTDGQLTFGRQPGVFKSLCDDAHRQPDRRFYLIIDEINRGDIPRIFGELLSILEKDKRGRPVLLPLSGEPFAVPDNVYVIGTMNTADRSIALLDTALRRRFGFIELMPDSTVLGSAVVENSIPLGPWLDALNERILENIGRDARNLQIGHAYLLDKGKPVTDLPTLARIVEEDILPLLEEYCYEDYTALAKILGAGLVDEAHQRVRHELFAPGRRDELIQALLAAVPEVTTSHQAVASEDEQLVEENGENHEEDEAEQA